MTKDREGLGEVGDYVGLEVNMRPAGGETPDMMNYAHSTDVFQIWADMVAFDKRVLPESEDHHWCVYAGRKEYLFEYEHSHEEIMEKYGDRIVLFQHRPEVTWATMGNVSYIAHAYSEKEVYEFMRFVQARREH